MIRLFLSFCVLLLSAAVVPAAETINLLRQPERLESWTVQQHENAVVLPKMQDGVLSLTVANQGSDSWHIQLFQGEIDLVEGETYTIRFRAKSDAPRSYQVYMGKSVPDYAPVSPHFTFQTGTDWKSFSFPFNVTNVVEGASRGPLFALGTQTGTLFLSDLAVEGPRPQAMNQPIPDGFFEFPLPYNDTLAGVITDVSFLNDKPAGRNGYIQAKDGHFIEERTGNRIRFFGTNMGADQAYPSKEDAEMIARRLAKAGVNIVRLHHLDNPWAIQTGGSIWAKDRPDRQQLDPVQLDKLDYLIHCLKEQGIYVNINLKVSKELTPADGMPASIKDVKTTHQKRIDYYMPRMIELQKDYARKLLTHRNPYTKLTYTEDPAVACIEINNENSLVGFWTATLGKDLDTLPKEFRDELSRQWTAWLKRKYSSDDQLTRSWMEGIEPAGPSLFSGSEQWVLETHEGTAALMETTQTSMGGTVPASHVRVTEVDGTDWHIQAKVEGITLQPGKQYTLSFMARADKPRTVRLGATVDQEDWHNVGLNQGVQLTTEEKPFTFSFTADNPVPQHTRISFSLGKEVGELWISAMELTPGIKGAGLREGESLAGGIGIPGSATERQWRDWIHFLADTERAFADTMYDLLKNELKIKANLALTQIDYGGTTGLHREQRMDFADAHGYWQHPSFPNADWSSTNWTIQNTPQVAAMAERAFGELDRIAMIRVAGKPYTVSEYDHPAPSDYVCEMMPTYAAFGCVQDWDIIYTFAIADYSSQSKPGHITGYFDQNNHPAKWGFYPTAALVFRRGLIPPAAEAATLQLPEPIWESYNFFERGWQSLIPQGPIGFLTRRLQVSDRPLPAGEKPRIVTASAGSAEKPSVTVVGAGGTRAMIAEGPQTSAFIGYLGGQSLSTAASQIEVDRFGNNFAAITAVATDNQNLPSSERVLLTVCGQVHNQGIKWNEKRNSIGAKWGFGPTVAQFIPATIKLDTDGARKVYALDASGKRKMEVASMRDAEGRLSFKTAPEHATLLYEIAK